MLRSTVAFIAAFSAALGIAAAAGARFLPDQATTPGALNPMVTQESIASTICQRGWTHTIKPAETYTERLKREQLHTPGSPYFAPGTRLRAWEEDHRVRLSLGGAPYDRYNFWPEARFGTWNAERKDELEGVVHDLVCRGRLTLAQGQAAFLGDWTLAYRRYLGEPRRANVTGAGPTASARLGMNATCTHRRYPRLSSRRLGPRPNAFGYGALRPSGAAPGSSKPARERIALATGSSAATPGGPISLAHVV